MTVPGGPSMATFLLMIQDKVARGELPIEQSYKEGKLELRYARNQQSCLLANVYFTGHLGTLILGVGSFSPRLHEILPCSTVRGGQRSLIICDDTRSDKGETRS